MAVDAKGRLKELLIPTSTRMEEQALTLASSLPTYLK
jgi:hypothetical protein